MTTQRELSLPPVPTNDILRERIAALEKRIRKYGNQGDHATALVLLKERTRLQKLIRATLEQDEKTA